MFVLRSGYLSLKVTQLMQEKGIEDLVAMLWSAITLEGINIMVFHHTSHGAILWRKFK